MVAEIGEVERFNNKEEVVILSVTTRWRYSPPRDSEFLHELTADSINPARTLPNSSARRPRTGGVRPPGAAGQGRSRRAWVH
ncbi:MAG: hypothetical protein ABEH88_06560 [Halobacteriales archaeon]